MNNDLILTSLSTAELKEIISEVIQMNTTQPQLQQEQKADEKIISRTELKEMLGISYVSIHKWMKSGKLKYLTFGRRTYFQLEDVKAFMQLGGGPHV